MAINTKGLNKTQIAAMAQKNAALEAKAEADRQAAMMAEIEALRAENATIKATKTRHDVVTVKLSTKGQIIVGGMSGWPVTMWLEDWEKLSAFIIAGKLDIFLAHNRAACAARPAKVA